MRDKIIEILQKQYDEENPWTTPYHRDTADEILQLRYMEHRRIIGYSFSELFDMENFARERGWKQERQSAEEQEYVQGRGVGVKADEFDTDDSVEKQKYTAGIDWLLPL